MKTALYFAYGSNMLTERLVARCPSARAVGVGCANGYVLAMAKPGTDLSGKATLLPEAAGQQYGVLFELAVPDLVALDRFEARGIGYDRDDGFVVERDDGPPVKAITYLALHPEPGLVPYDWYMALIVAGARQHNLPRQQIDALRAIPCMSEDRNAAAREGRALAMAALADAGYDPGVIEQRLAAD